MALAAYLGQGVVAGVLLDKMPAAMRKDVDAAIAELPPGKRQPSRFTRREAAERAAREPEAEALEVDGGEGAAGGGGDAAADEEPVRLAGWGKEGGRAAWPRGGQPSPCMGRRASHGALRMAARPPPSRGSPGGTWRRGRRRTLLPPPPSRRDRPRCRPHSPLQEGDPYEFASPVDILGPLAKAQCVVDDDPPVAFWEALDAKKWGLRKVGRRVRGCGGVVLCWCLLGVACAWVWCGVVHCWCSLGSLCAWVWWYSVCVVLAWL